MRYGWIKVAAYTHRVVLASPKDNARLLAEGICEMAKQGVKFVVTPELGLTGYTCGDLFLQEALLQGSLDGLAEILRQTATCDTVAAVGLPLVVGGKLYNCAAVICHGRILGVVAKHNLPTYSEFYEGRYFAVPPRVSRQIELLGQEVPFGGYQVYQCKELANLALGIEICEDLWVTDAPHSRLARAGATILGNLSASNQVAGKNSYRQLLVRSAAARCQAGYIYCDTSPTESTGDEIFTAHNIISESGYVLAESTPYGSGVCVSEVDVDRLVYERRRISSYLTDQTNVTVVPFSIGELVETKLSRSISPLPFVPEGVGALRERAHEILEMQAHALAHRYQHIHAKSMVIGVSGGLDSTMALLVCVRAADLMGIAREQAIHAITMPCFGTGKRTLNNAKRLCKLLGVPLRVINIANTVKSHLKDIEHEEGTDLAFENSQARTRTMVLMNVANQEGGFVVGTGDLSELAVGWCTYNGDHMSMYSVNCSVPKSLMKRMLPYYAPGELGLQAVLNDIIDTPISPELLPAVEGQMVQKSEETVGSYDVNDFILYYLMRWGFAPKKIFQMMQIAFPHLGAEGAKESLRRFYRRFFTQQFKRNCVPDGVKVGTVCLSPRGDWRMPSDAMMTLWLDEIEGLDV